MPELVVATVLFAISVLTALVAVGARALRQNRDTDSFIAWRRSMGPLFTVGFGPGMLRLQEWLLTAIALAAFAASIFIALNALFAT